MIKASAPRKSGGCSWVLLSIVLIGGSPLAARSQTAAPKDAPPNADAKPEANPDAEVAPSDQGIGSVVKQEDKKPAAQVEVFRDPRAEKLLAENLNNFKPMGRSSNPRIIGAVKAMAGMPGGNVDRPSIEQYVDLMISELTNHNNIRALVDPASGIPASSGAHRAIKEATNDLIEPILMSRTQGGNASFLPVYNQILLQKLEPVLSRGHLLSRVEAAIVLSQTGNPNAVDVLVRQISNPDQVLWVDLSALRGLTNIQQFSRYNPDARFIPAAKAVSDFMTREKDLPWWIQYRALEALGSLRQASLPSRPIPDMATTATQYLTDPSARPEVRAEAGWALGMMQVPGSISDYNYPMIAHSLGDVAVALGERAREAFPNNPTQAGLYTALLISQLYQAFEGVDGARDSGLLKSTHPSAVQARPFLREVFDRIKPVAASAVKLVGGPTGQAQKNLAELDAKTKALKAWLEKNPPANAWLVPNGPKFPLNGAQVANAPGGPAQVANGRGGR